MAQKDKPSNKSEKTKLENKADKPAAPKKAKAIDWDALDENLTVVGAKSGNLKEGQEYLVTKATAKLLVTKGTAKLK